jgi:mRNA interferase MazF
MNEGDVVLSPLPQADGWAKNRPCVALRRMPGFGDWLVCGISTQLRQEVPGFDESVRPGDADFPASGLKAASLIRLGFLAVLPEDRLLGAIGALAPERPQRLLGRLSAYLTQAAG